VWKPQKSTTSTNIVSSWHALAFLTNLRAAQCAKSFDPSVFT
jgi:hypothetical protein